LCVIGFLVQDLERGFLREPALVRTVGGQRVIGLLAV
jgi:hypothetical protein